MCLGCCLFSIVKVSIVVVGALLGTLNSRIPRLLDVACERSISWHVKFLKMQNWVGKDMGWDLCWMSMMNCLRNSWGAIM